MEHPIALPSPVQAALRDAASGLRQIFRERLVRIVLFGSYARGEARTSSDVNPSDLDILVVLRDLKRPAAEVLQLGELRLDLLLTHGIVVAFLPISESRSSDATLPIVQSIRRDGVEIEPQELR